MEKSLLVMERSLCDVKVWISIQGCKLHRCQWSLMNSESLVTYMTFSEAPAHRINDLGIMPNKEHIGDVKVIEISYNILLHSINAISNTPSDQFLLFCSDLPLSLISYENNFAFVLKAFEKATVKRYPVNTLEVLKQPM